MRILSHFMRNTNAITCMLSICTWNRFTKYWENFTWNHVKIRFIFYKLGTYPLLLYFNRAKNCILNWHLKADKRDQNLEISGFLSLILPHFTFSDIWLIFHLSFLCSGCKALSRAAIQLSKQRSSVAGIGKY